MIKQFRIDSIEAKRFIDPRSAPQHIRIDNNSSILSVHPVDEKNVKVEFKFTVTYTGIGMIAIDGTLIYTGDAKKILEEWRKSRKLPDDIAREIHGTIINNCVIESVILAKEVSLPPPIPPPAQMLQQSAQKSKEKGDVVGYA